MVKQSPLYPVWSSMKRRCYNKNTYGYEHYGGRGIVVCDEWLHDSESFIDWALLSGWSRGLYFDRINNDGNYEPSNCRFVTPQTSSCNTRLLANSNKSGYRGVHWHKDNKKWVSQMTINGKRTYFGCFDSPRLAAIRYDVEAFLLDDGRPMNFIEAR